MVKDKKIFCSYYTNNNQILDYMVSQIDLNGNILEPCGGDGVFIDKMIEINPDVMVDTLDSNQVAVDNMSEKYKNNKNITIWYGDTLFDKKIDNNRNKYNSIIGNPPYGAWQSIDRRKDLKNKYPNCYVKESYTMFLIRCFELLSKNGKLCFIIPDTFLYLHRHENLRKMLLEKSCIHKILTFPSKLFPGVHFGYAKLSIITITKKIDKNNFIEIYNSIKKNTDFLKIKNEEIKPDLYLKQSDIISNKSCAFEINDNEIDIKKIKNVAVDFSDYVDCVTGIYTGDNKKYIKRKNDSIKNSKGYLDLDVDDKSYIPLVKGTSEKAYVCEDSWYINWSDEAIKHYNEDKKARYQNSQYYFKRGIAYPMVKSKNSKAILMENRVFDQSIVGIFPKSEEYLFYILGFMNSPIFTKLLFIINPSANGSANYIKKISFIKPSDIIVNKVSKLVKEIINDYSKLDINQATINDIIKNLYDIV